MTSSTRTRAAPGSEGGSPFDLTGRVALVTGAAGGIGLATAEVLASAGARVVLTDVVGPVVAARATALRDAGLACDGQVLDVTDRAAVDAVVDAVVAEHGRLDVMVDNAAVIDDATPLEVTDADLDRVHAVNFRGVVACSQAAARVMLRAGGGSIVTVTSGVLDLGSPTVAAYASAKAAAAQYSRGWPSSSRRSAPPPTRSRRLGRRRSPGSVPGRSASR